MRSSSTGRWGKRSLELLFDTIFSPFLRFECTLIWYICKDISVALLVFSKPNSNSMPSYFCTLKFTTIEKKSTRKYRHKRTWHSPEEPPNYNKGIFY
jgi:hypothetical protein